MRDQDVQAILREMVNDLEKTSAFLNYISDEVQGLSLRRLASVKDAVDSASRYHKNFYDSLRKKIDALTPTPSDAEKYEHSDDHSNRI